MLARIEVNVSAKPIDALGMIAENYNMKYEFDHPSEIIINTVTNSSCKEHVGQKFALYTDEYGRHQSLNWDLSKILMYEELLKLKGMIKSYEKNSKI